MEITVTAKKTLGIQIAKNIYGNYLTDLQAQNVALVAAGQGNSPQATLIQSTISSVEGLLKSNEVT